MNILVTLNRGYLKYLKVMLFSLCENNPHNNFDVYVVHNSLTSEDFCELSFIRENLSVHSVSVPSEFLKDAPTTDRYPKEMYYRIFVSRLLPKTVDRVLYLDPDIVVINSVDKLYNVDLGDNLFAAASHLDENGIITAVNDIRLSVPMGTGYYNSGVMVMDLEKLRKELSEKDIFDFIRRHKSSLILPDQDVLNGVYGHRVKSLNPYIYNLSDRILTIHNVKNIQSEKKIFLDWIDKNTVIIHYCGRNKPWKEKYIGELDFYYKIYERLLEEKEAKTEGQKL